ncbi:MAG: T9SS type A sorting domain-containing protein [Calditrichaeota bacterium]|nr:T9SS type A sorting domain-containing protein [Calditrichota bacterium]
MNFNFLKIVFFFLLLSNILFAQFSGFKIMVNPGHGGHDSDDRFIPATGFWESEGNLTKGLYLRDLLEARGAEVIMSRTQNRTEDDLPLSQISGIANSNNVDYFQSIHSNGFQGTANRTSVFWEQKENGQPDFPDAKRASEILADKIFEVNFTTSTATHGDLQYLGFNLGVLRSLNMPGCLTEGSFHDYIPESYRLLNLDYRKHEAVAILRGMLEYFDLPALEHGAIAGITKDKSKTVSYNFSGGKTNDKYKPINNIFASLYQDETFLKSYKGDFNNNGYFVFDSLAPGSYTVIVDDGSYAADTLLINVTANKTSFKEVFLISDSEKEPLVYSTTPENSDSGLNTYSALYITFSRPMNTDSTEEAFSILPIVKGVAEEVEGTFSWQESNQVLVFSPSAAFNPQTDYQVTVSTKAQSSSNINMIEPYQFSFSTADQHNYPKVTKTLPVQGDSITIFENFEVFFSQEMIREKVEQALLIEPLVEGSLSWTNNKHFIFTPDSLSINTVYTITLQDSIALNEFSVGLENDYVFSFKTYNRSSLNILEWFPQQGDTSISTRTNFFFHFDGNLDVGTVVANLSLKDEDQNNLELDSYKLGERNGTSVLSFIAKEELGRKRKFTLTILPGIKDVDGLVLEDSLSFNFTTQIAKYKSGLVFDDFEEDSGWKDPEFGPATQNVDLSKSAYYISFSEQINGFKSALLKYQFSGDSAGICQVFREEAFDLTFADSSFFGLWVYGDFSFNTLELWYDVDGQQYRILELDTLDFSGWKLVKFPVSQFDGSEISLHSIVVKQQPGAYTQGTIYIDDLQYDVVTALQKTDNPIILTKFNLQQNYPNPFNPNTTISYTVRANSNSPQQVKLVVYDLLGRRVKTLIDKPQQAGKYKVAFDASGLASGVYYYRIKIGPSTGSGTNSSGSGSGFEQVRKMLLLR